MEQLPPVQKQVYQIQRALQGIENRVTGTPTTSQYLGPRILHYKSLGLYPAKGNYIIDSKKRQGKFPSLHS